MTGVNKWALCFVGLLWIQSCVAQQAETPVAAQTRAEIATLGAMLPKVPDRAAVLYYLATDYAQIGDSQKALALLKECVAANEGFNPDKDPALRSLYSNEEFRALVAEAEQRYPAVHKAHIAFTVPQKDLIPEGLVFDSGKETFYLSSLFHRKIVRFGMNGEVSDFVAQKKYGLLPICGLRVETADHSLWAAGCQDSGHGELYHFDVNGNLLERFPPSTPGKHLFNDLVLRGDSEVYLTDSLANLTYRFNRKTHVFTALSLPRPLFYPNGITLSDDQNLLYIADAFGVLQYNLKTNAAREVDRGTANTLGGIDGLYWYHGKLIGVQALGQQRIAQFSLSPDGLRVRSVSVLEYRSPHLTLASTGTVKDSSFYFIENSQIDGMQDEKIVNAEKLEPVRIGVIGLMPVEQRK